MKATITAPKHIGTGVPASASSHKRCPWCDRLVDKISSFCRSCGFKFNRPEFLKKCPSCDEVLFAFSVLCPTCRFDVHSYYERLARQAKRVEDRVEHFVKDTLEPDLVELEERVEAAGRRVASHIRPHFSSTLIHRGAPPGLRCFRCGAGVRVGSTRCPTCRVRVVLG